MEQKRQIKKFILFVIKLCLILGAVYYAFQGLFWFLWEYDNGPNAYDKAYQHALYLQYQQLTKEDRPNEIIFFGSSTCAFGIDVDTVEEVTGTPAQIFAIESAITPNFLTNQLREIAKPGDTICYVFDSDTITDDSFINICCAFEEDKEFLHRYWAAHSYEYNQFRQMLCWRKLYALAVGNTIENLRSSISSKEQVYSITSFDEKGNMRLNSDECLVSQDIETYRKMNFDDINPELLDILNDFSIWCSENDITFVIAYNMSPKGIFIDDDASMLAYHTKLESVLDAPIITKPQDGLLPVDCFYNSYYHLNTKGAQEYSRRIAENLLEFESN